MNFHRYSTKSKWDQGLSHNIKVEAVKNYGDKNLSGIFTGNVIYLYFIKRFSIVWIYFTTAIYL
jgi:hypothetical protein